MPKISGALSTYPARVSFAAYVILILLGSAVLRLPICHASSKEPISWIDALFTCTSACCVTGLGVRSTGSDFSFFGQFIILVLIQIGGIGILTITNFLMLQIGGAMQLRDRRVLHETLGAHSSANLAWVLRNVLLFTFAAEAVGTVLLFLRFAFNAELSLAQSVWHSVFHSISAFCNAGFSLNDTSLVHYQDDWLVNVTVCMLIVFGGIGFPVILDLLRHRRGGFRERLSKLYLHTKMMLAGTAGFIIFGAVSIAVLEWNEALEGKSTAARVMVPIFQSITCRTAGFSTIDQAELSMAALTISIFLMLVGGGPCSTAGGVKVTSMLMIILNAFSRVSGHSTTSIFRRTIPKTSIDKATTVVLFYVSLAAVALLMILVIENSIEFGEDPKLFLRGIFEVISALGTVGLSINLTTELSDPSLLVIIALMFVGRLGPVSVFAALSLPEKDKSLQYISEEPLVG